ncbi:asparaginase [uncultured Limnohabitans sp.]|jgi:L-asparaginase|uniref:asparaginase n=1 Tax=uncultured Limnohabitans sp. TaxID=768543 RepID=UPI00261E3CB0|nr:asparaginase [uncultured Limnohabitans sp.]
MTKPTLALIGTGGTIAGAASAASVSTDYKPASLSLAAVVDTVPELRARYDIEVSQPMQLASYDVRPEHWLDLHAAVMHAANNPDVVGIVVTHGTDTLEETATFLHLSVASDKPIVVVGAMRPATAYSADGPANLLDACSVAACPGARGRGTLVVMNGRIHSGLWVGKRHVSSVEAFDSPLAGAVGEVADQSVQWFRAAARAPTVAWQTPTAWPRVDIAVAYAGVDETAMRAFVAAGARGIVHAGLGNANTPTAYRAFIQSLPAQGVLVARCARFITGSVTRASVYADAEHGILTAGPLPPHKVRIVMLLGLAHGMDGPAIQTWIDQILQAS